MPSYRPENPDVQFDFGDKIAPRAGFAWDVTGNARWKLYGSWGVFYDLMKLTIGRVMFGASHSDDAYFTLDTPDWPSITCPQPLVCSLDVPVRSSRSWMESRRQISRAVVSWIPISTRHKARSSRAASITSGVHRHQSVFATHKWVDRAIGGCVRSKLCVRCEQPGLRHWCARSAPRSLAQPPAKRVYDSVEFRVRKRLANRWSLDTNYVLSRLWGNWSGIASTDEAVLCLNPNSCTAFNSFYYSFDHAAQPTYGPLGTDRPHRAQGSGDLRLHVGNHARRQLSGAERPAVLDHHEAAGSRPVNFFPYGRGDLGRTPPLSARSAGQHEFRLPHRVRLRAGINVLNAFDQRAAINIVSSAFRDPPESERRAILRRFRSLRRRGGNCGSGPTPGSVSPTTTAPRVVTFQMHVTF